MTEVNCPICGARARFLWKLPHTGAYRCTRGDCRLEFAWPQSDDATLARAYTELYYPANGNGHVELENTPEVDAGILLDHIAANWKRLAGLRLLDYGCGRGTLLCAAQKRGAEVTGIEMDPVARGEAAQATGSAVFADLAALQAAAPAACFDCIVLCTVIEHLRFPWEEIGRLRAVLAPEGLLVATTANSACLKARLRGAAWDQRTNRTHFYYFDERSMAAALRHAGFDDVWALPPITTYSNHGAARRALQHVLAAVGLQGSIILAASGGPAVNRSIPAAAVVEA